MKFEPFATVESYAMMLRRIAMFAFSWALLAMILLRSQITSLDQALDAFSIPMPLIGLELPMGTVVPAFLYALVSLVFKLHDRISDLFRIREEFDFRSILLPEALASGAVVPMDKIPMLISDRNPLMTKVFYKYASSTPGQAAIDPHYITMALDQWGWYWVALEAAVVAGITSIILAVYGKLLPAYLLICLVLACIVLLRILRRKCSHYASEEVEQILMDTDRKHEVKTEFDAL